MPALLNAPYWYIGSTKWTAVTAWTASTATSVGALVRQTSTPTLGNERVFVCVVAGTTGGGEPFWTVTKGQKTVDNSVTWQECTGQPAVNGDATNTLDWNSAKSHTVALGQIIKNTAATHFFICTAAGTSGSGSEPSWNTTTGATTADGSVTWTCLGTTGSFSAWGAPHKRLPNALSTGWGTNGDTFYISNNHAESQSVAWNYTLKGTAASPCNYLCVTDTAAPPTALSTTATISVTGSSVNLVISGSVYFYMYGVTFSAGASTDLTSLTFQAYSQIFDSCGFTFGSTNSGNTINLSASTAGDASTVFRDCSFTFAASGQTLVPRAGRIDIIGGSIGKTGTAPSTAFTMGSYSGAMIVRDCDISGVTGTLTTVGGTGSYDTIFAYCSLGSGITLASGTIGGAGQNTLRVHNCDDAATNYRMYTSYYTGTSQQNTSTYNNAGATDGTTRISWQVDTSSNASFTRPFSCEQIFQWVDTTGSELTATVEIAGGASLNDDDIWMDVEFMGSTVNPLGSIASCRKADILASNTAVPSSTASWSGSPAVTQKLQVSFTPQMKGPVKARIYVAKPNATVYVDPLVTIA